MRILQLSPKNYSRFRLFCLATCNESSSSDEISDADLAELERSVIENMDNNASDALSDAQVCSFVKFLLKSRAFCTRFVFFCLKTLVLLSQSSKEVLFFSLKV